MAAASGMVGCLTGYLLGGLLGRLLERAVGLVERSSDRIPVPQLLCGVFGGLVGGVLGIAFGAPLVVLLQPQVGLPAGGIVMSVCLYLGYRVASHRTEELFAMAGLSTRPLVHARAYDDADGFLVDSSAVMDTQLLPLCRSGLFRDDLLVPRFVLDELQGMADGGDERGRRAVRGLETLEVLRRDAPNRVYIVDDEVPEVQEVDAKLVALARKLQLRLLTNDVNLARVAEVQGVLTVIPRRLAADLVPGVLAGETIQVSLTARDGTRVRVWAFSRTARWLSSTAVWISSMRDRCRSSCRPSCRRAPAASCSLVPRTTARPRAPPTVRTPGSDPRMRHHEAVSVWAIVVAAGSGARFGGFKQLQRLGDRRVIDHAVAAAATACDGVVVAQPFGVEWDLGPVLTVTGGATRSASVRAALAAVPEGADIVVVHDGRGHSLVPRSSKP